jgi:hypothetical protein
MISSSRSRCHQRRRWPVSWRPMVPSAPTMLPTCAESITADDGSTIAAAGAAARGASGPPGPAENTDMVVPFVQTQNTSRCAAPGGCPTDSGVHPKWAGLVHSTAAESGWCLAGAAMPRRRVRVDVAHQLDQRLRQVRRLGDGGRISTVTQHRPSGQHPDAGSRCAVRPPTRHAARRPHTRRWACSSMILILSGVRQRCPQGTVRRDIRHDKAPSRRAGVAMADADAQRREHPAGGPRAADRTGRYAGSVARE